MSAHELCRDHKRLLPLIEFALSEGWEVGRTGGGYLKFTKPGLPPIFTSSTASDYRSSQNAWARLCRATRNLPGGGNG
ncbi:type II toxin-antitoxin system HicA family toxin [Pseudomonas aeruginosa]|uniref:type II toxin-antitoxin system HicA family toxin n=1 Tax=Pseudomonas TaxID=286 RepID=UPI0015577CD7|nr:MULTISPECIES: type II toxin-antitoxin system HicA family toxin [Pseudomonas]MCK2120695.1 type II toxin-antitoxin system HicA family toxin [Pseudomonas sp. PNPG3]QKF01533.1 type II toxin-antitoxin system HicA family toxin [Pseudomonas aeruginosa]HCF1525333.1 type II toxin-antitoxin system HicA family toxin [Pseudomonas aeruginosa]HEP8863450.1 type II toxin-antitoxin system HicA family toxin [Pseudomonas aeruginosa]